LDVTAAGWLWQRVNVSWDDQFQTLWKCGDDDSIQYNKQHVTCHRRIEGFGIGEKGCPPAKGLGITERSALTEWAVALREML
jgi:hypothetical protein